MEDAGFDPSLTNEATELLIQSTREISPNLASLRPADAWTGFRPFAPDGLPILGPMPNVESLFLALGHFRNGILLSPVTAKLIAADIRRDSALGTPKEFTGARFVREEVYESGLRAAMQSGERKQYK
jgi:glycine oxidase